MPRHEARERGQETVGHPFAVDAADDLVVVEPLLLEKEPAQRFVAKPFQQVPDELPADVRPASFVAQNPAQRRRVAHDAHAVVVAGVRSRAEDAGDARTAAQQRAGRPHEVGFDGDACRGEITRQRLPQAGALFGVAFAAAGAVEMERVGLHRFREGLAEQRLHFVGALEHGVDATALYAAYAAAVVDELPVAFGRSAVCDYDHRFGREFTGFRFLCGARFSGGSARTGRKYSNKCRKKSRIIGSKAVISAKGRSCSGFKHDSVLWSRRSFTEFLFGAIVRCRNSRSGLFRSGKDL